jgi:histidine triad (HIT) family protein
MTAITGFARRKPVALNRSRKRMQDASCIFCRIVRGEIPSSKVYEDEQVLAFQDIHPIAPVHFLLIPKEHVPTLSETRVDHEAVLGKMIVLAPRLAREQGADDGFRLIVNTGRVGRQEVLHLHMHVLGGKEPLGSMLPRPKT